MQKKCRKRWFSKGNPLISGKPRLLKYYNFARLLGGGFEICFWNVQTPAPVILGPTLLRRQCILVKKNHRGWGLTVCIYLYIHIFIFIWCVTPTYVNIDRKYMCIFVYIYIIVFYLVYILDKICIVIYIHNFVYIICIYIYQYIVYKIYVCYFM